MAKTKTAPLTPAEIKAKKKDLQTALKNIDAGLKPYKDEVIVAKKAKSDAEKAVVRALADVNKRLVAATTKLEKAQVAAEKGRTKLHGLLAQLSSLPT